MYRCLTQQSFEDHDGYQITSISLEKEYIEKIRLWRNNQMDVLRQQTLIHAKEQYHYFNTYIKPTLNEDHPKQILFSYFYKDTFIGYGGLINIDWISKRAEISFLIDSNRASDSDLYKIDFHHFLTLVCSVAFKHLGFHRLFTETFAFRKEHMNILEDFGFRKEGVLREHTYKKEKWYDSIMHGLLAQETPHAK